MYVTHRNSITDKMAVQRGRSFNIEMKTKLLLQLVGVTELIA